ncbi:MAG: hypothetical protein M1142_02365 [Patescibacteria group bacterium]|nr:hypothetical protein [Patescibacteria group bacterium]
MPRTFLTMFGSDYFALNIKQYKKHTKIKMKLQFNKVTTRHFPVTYSILEKLLPGIYEHQCFNKDELPFSREVRNTEIGHLFEHVLMEYLCQAKTKQNRKETIYKGTTKWDWEKQPLGTFEITVSIGYQDTDLFTQALKQSVNLLNTILQPFLPLEVDADNKGIALKPSLCFQN